MVQGSASVRPGNARSLQVSASRNESGITLLHAHIGDIYICMQDENWRILFAAITELEPTVEPGEYKIVFNDTTREAKVVTA
jgi:hypothetical protein